MFYRWLLALVPTWALQDALGERSGVRSAFLAPGESLTLELKGVCWVTINED